MPRSSRNKTNKHMQFLARIKDKDLICLTEYSRATEKMKFKCQLDGYEWWACPSDILRRRTNGCPMCAGKVGNAIVEDHGTWLKVDVSTRSNKNKVMLIDKADWALLGTLRKEGGYKTRGKVSADFGQRMFYGSIVLNGRPCLVHRLLLSPKKDEQIDHIDGNGLNNRRSNLRICSSEDNKKNRKIPSNNTSGILGVSFNKKSCRWVAYIQIDGKPKQIGSFMTKTDATKARREAEKKYYGDFRRTYSRKQMGGRL